MIAIRREFVVEVPQEAAWEDLSQIERWPSWAKHIKRVELMPAGELGPKSKGVIHLSNGIKSEFTMTEFNPYRNWKWVGPFLWLTIYYDHIFEPLDPRRTRLIWIVEAEGFGVSILGRLFAKIYNRNLDKAIPLLISEINARNCGRPD
jgi:Polyketide cyclase / dehydrase and lipid transport